MPISAPPLEGFVVIVLDEAEVARRLELALAHAGAAVFVTLSTRETLDLMWTMKPIAVVLDPAPDRVGALFLAAQAKEQGIPVIQFSDSGEEDGGAVRISRDRPASAVVEAVIAVTRGQG